MSDVYWGKRDYGWAARKTAETFTRLRICSFCVVCLLILNSCLQKPSGHIFTLLPASALDLGFYVDPNRYFWLGRLGTFHWGCLIGRGRSAIRSPWSRNDNWVDLGEEICFISI